MIYKVNSLSAECNTKSEVPSIEMKKKTIGHKSKID